MSVFDKAKIKSHTGRKAHRHKVYGKFELSKSTLTDKIDALFLHLSCEILALSITFIYN